MAATMEDVEMLFQKVRLLRAERIKMEKLSHKALHAPAGKASRKASVDLNLQAFHVVRLEHEVHAAAVDAGIADAREPEHYEPYSVRLSGFHEYEVIPRKPKLFTGRFAAKREGCL